MQRLTQSLGGRNAPWLWIGPADMPTAGYTGSGDHAVVSVSTDVWDALTVNGREALVAHEIAHHVRRDKLRRPLGAIACTLPLAALPALVGPWWIRIFVAVVVVWLQGVALGFWSRHIELDADRRAKRVTSAEALTEAINVVGGLVVFGQQTTVSRSRIPGASLRATHPRPDRRLKQLGSGS